MLRHRLIVIAPAALACAFAATTAACKKDKAGDTPGGTTGTGSDLKATLSLFPADADAVVGINFGKIRDSGLYKKYEPQIQKAIGTELAKLKDACGADPLAQMQSTTFAVKSADKTVTVLVRGFDKKLAGTCAQKSVELAKAKGEDASVVVDGNYIEWKQDGKTSGALFIDDNTLLTSVKDGQGIPRAELEALAKPRPEAQSLVASAEFMDVVSRTDTTDAVWFVANGASPAMAQAPVKFQSAFGSVEVTDGLKIEGAARFETEEIAKQTADGGKAQVEQMKASMFGSMVSDITIDQKGKDVIVKVGLTQQQLESIAGMIGPALGQMAQ
jgi:hypothetical protein